MTEQTADTRQSAAVQLPRSQTPLSIKHLWSTKVVLTVRPGSHFEDHGDSHLLCRSGSRRSQTPEEEIQSGRTVHSKG